MIRLAVSVRGDDAGVVLAELLELSPAGVEERDLDGGGVEYVIYGAPGELPELPALEAAAGDVLVDVATSEVADDWDERWKQWHKAIDVGGGARRLRVRPPWEPPAAGPDVLELVIDPGQAFGTGGHATTRLCLELLLTLEPRGAFADWGSGTGVLAIAAAKLGFTPVVAVDYDPLSVDATRENAYVNAVELTSDRVNLRETPGPYAPTVCANLLRPLLLEVAHGLERAPDHLILSGLLREEADEVAAAFAPHGLTETERRSCAEWSALRLERTG
ncbi:MAG: ribosomal protein methyltransferase [Solirubrobacteraceae bacterium]|nr:ribosomal protein methyltransferase [Solirubrobacteraceae bacterium]